MLCPRRAEGAARLGIHPRRAARSSRLPVAARQVLPSMSGTGTAGPIPYEALEHRANDSRGNVRCI